MELTILQWLFQSIPECLALASIAIVLTGVKLDIKKILSIGLPHAIAVYLVRLLPLTFGVHFIIFIAFLAILLNVVLKIKLSRSLLTALVALIILAAAEIAFITLILSITGITFEQASQNIMLLIAYGWPHIIFLFVMALTIEKLWKNRRSKEESYNA